MTKSTEQDTSVAESSAAPRKFEFKKATPEEMRKSAKKVMEQWAVAIENLKNR